MWLQSLHFAYMLMTIYIYVLNVKKALKNNKHNMRPTLRKLLLYYHNGVCVCKMYKKINIVESWTISANGVRQK